jgi:hypothetical protein
MKLVAPEIAAPQLLGDIRLLIEQSRSQLAAAVNSALTLLYWRIGHRIRTEVLGGERATYGEQIVSALSRQLETDYGRGFSAKNLRHMLRFAEAFPDVEIVSAARRQLSWTHFRTLVHHVAEYLTALPPKELLQAKLHEAIARSRARLENRAEEG